ncbi:MAG: GrlR family regulatory protein [Rhizobiaceae bacterium]
MLTDGLYRVSFQTPMGMGAGVIVLSGGRMRGGDSSIYYVGTYSQAGDEFTASVATDRHTAGLASVFGVDRVHISLRGRIKDGSVTMQGSAAEAPGISFQAMLMKLSD